MPDLNSQPLDPDEPTYCLCNQVSFGEMIGCDNEEVRLFMLKRLDEADMEDPQSHPTQCCLQAMNIWVLQCPIEWFLSPPIQCPIEWFHFQCVGLTSKPKGKWYCPQCTTDKKQRATK